MNTDNRSVHHPTANDQKDFNNPNQDFSISIKQGKRIADLRTTVGFSPQALARQANLTLANLLALELGILSLDNQKVEQLSAALGVNKTLLMNDDPN